MHLLKTRKAWMQPSRRVIAGFVSLCLLLVLLLIMLVTRLWQQDQDLERQRIQARLEIAGNEIASQLEASYSQFLDNFISIASHDPDSLKSAIPALSEMLDEDGVICTSIESVHAFYPEGRLLYTPDRIEVIFIDHEELQPGSLLEFRNTDLAAATTFYRRYGESADLQLRAEALIGLGRVLHKSGRIQEAVQAYTDLMDYEEQYLSGVPADLIAIERKATLLSERNNAGSELREATQETAVDLYRGLTVGRWKLSKGAFEFYMQRASHLLESQGISDAPYPADLEQRLNLSEAINRLIATEFNRDTNEAHPTSTFLFIDEETPFQILSNRNAESEVTLIMGSKTIERLFLAGIRSHETASEYHFALNTPDGRALVGSPTSWEQPYFMQPASVTGLPWNFYLESNPNQHQPGLWSNQRGLFIAGLGLLLLLIMASIYMLVISVQRQIGMARLESQFVSAVSHEFRSPLTSIRQVGEMLASGRIETPEQTKQYYAMLQQDTARLQRLVENFLDFGRSQAGARQYTLSVFDPGELISQIVADFIAELNDPDCEITVDAQIGSMLIKADQEAIERVVWNLLDNAVRYSPDKPHIQVAVNLAGEDACITVSDDGLGIEPDEVHLIFHRFVRGAAAEHTGSRGTGIGLALVKQLIEAHGGSIEAENKPDAGSVFTVRIPLEAGI